ncbi:hypothetical protein QMO56_17330 [Roseomonas sp. E05]|uniref:hypothetical protein n=1 Tax=Roseomonas sp. E05 TaxID=3046310 RepID=UPI0024B8EB5A|nr:hypothetical protein [Roseomonas sp. E05]MDJ0389872.1 hypothetical protein [Roseomonas sp. E05]
MARFRRARLDDAGQTAAMHAEAYRATYGPLLGEGCKPRPRDALHALWTSVLKRGEQVWLAEANGGAPDWLYRIATEPSQ